MTRALPASATRRAQLGLCLSPYHLTSREIPAMFACLLADRVLTVLPLEREEAGVETSAMARLMDAWSWSAPLWEDGLIGSRLHADDARADIDDVMREIIASGRLAPLHPFVRLREDEDPGRWLERIASDLMRGGPDPGLCVPISAALDRFAARRGVAVVRASATSLAQQAEARLAQRLFAFAMPMIGEAPADRLLEARRTLAPELDDLREAVSCAFAAALESASGDLDQVRAASERYSQAFERGGADLLRAPDDPDDPRVVGVMVSVTGVLLPADTVLRSSLSAVQRASGRRPQRLPAPDPGARVPSLIVRRIGR